MKGSRRLKFLIFAMPLALALLFVSIKLTHPAAYNRLIQEDAFCENVQAATYLASFLLAVLLLAEAVAQRALPRAFLLACLSLALLLTFGEEISWGQRILGYAAPDFFLQYNRQKEVSIHNLCSVHEKLHLAYVIIGLYGALGWLPWRLPYLNRLQRESRLAALLAPPWYASLYFLGLSGLYALLTFPNPLFASGRVVFRDQEPAELLLAMGMLIWVVTLCAAWEWKIVVSSGEQPARGVSTVPAA